MTLHNIFDIHQSILKSFHDEEERLPSLHAKQQELEQMVSDHDTTVPIRNTLSSEISHTSHRIQQIHSKENLYYYLLKSAPILQEYKKEISKPIELTFMGEQTKVDHSHLNRLYHQYVDSVKHLYPVLDANPSSNKPKGSCTLCSEPTEQMIPTTNTIACAKCGTEQDNLKFTFSYKDTDRVNISSKYTYDRRLHFKECINQLQGKQNSTIKPIVYEKIIEQLVQHGIVSADTSIPREERFKHVKKSQILLFLKEIHCSHHYEDINIIYHHITGNPLDDISHLEQVLMDDFDVLSKLYDEEYIKTKKINRKNFINTQYVLYQLLRRHKHPCKKSDFTFLKTLERKNFHDEVCSHLFKKLGWNFTCMF